MKKNSILATFILSLSLGYAQQVEKTFEYEIPYLGKNGGQRIINMDYDKNNQELIINVYSNVNGGQMVANPDEVKKQKESHNEKDFFGRLLSSLGQSNDFKYVVLPIAQENRVNVNTNESHKKEYIFYTLKEVPEGMKVYFTPNSNVVDVNFRFNQGTTLDYSYKDIHKVLESFPKMDEVLLQFGNIEFKGEGMLGLKNIEPMFMKKEIIFRYDPAKGIMTSPISTEIDKASNILSDNDSKYITDSNQIQKTKIYSWYENEDKGEYKLLIYDVNTQASKVLTFNFENLREPKVLNKKIYNQEGNAVGLLSIFGYHKKQDKHKKQYQKNEFNVIVTDLDGNEQFNEIISYGDEKRYKKVFNPIYIVKKNDGKIYFSNFNMKNLLNGDYEVCSLDTNNKTISTLLSQDPVLTIDGNRLNAYSVFINYDEIYTLGGRYYFIKSNQEDDSKTNQKVFKGFEMVVTDNNLKPIKVFKSGGYSISRVQSQPIKFYKVLNDGNEIVFLDKQGTQFGMTKIKGNDIVHSVIETPFVQSASLEEYYGYFNQRPFLVDEDNRTLYLINQYYKTVENNIRLIDKVGVTKVTY